MSSSAFATTERDPPVAADRNAAVFPQALTSAALF
eukprot:COSAG01_NODE_49403_length_372_cov_1.124542_1_plen_34_part_10